MRLLHSSILLAAAAVIALAGCQSAPHGGQATTADAASHASASDAVSAGALADQPVATLWVHGMACPQCSYNVDLQLKKVPGVESVKVDMFTGKVRAYLSRTDPPTREQLVGAIDNTTFTLVRIEMPGETAR